MPRKPCYWTRKLELELVEFIRERDFVWRPCGNTNHHIQLKYKAFAEFAAKLGRGFTARSVRDRWVNIRSTFNHNLRRVDKSRETALTPDQVYVPCWPLWKPLQFLREVTRKDDNETKYGEYSSEQLEYPNSLVKEESLTQSDVDDSLLMIRQRPQRTDRPRRKTEDQFSNQRTDRPRRRALDCKDQTSSCAKVLDDLVKAMEPFKEVVTDQTYKHFGKHVTERLNGMREMDSQSASAEIMKLLDEWESIT